jgi:hypothetical protein
MSRSAVDAPLSVAQTDRVGIPMESNHVLAFGYGQALHTTTARELCEYGQRIRAYASAHGFVLDEVFIDPHPEKAPRFVDMIQKWKRLELKPTIVVIPHPYGMGRPRTDVEKLILLRRYELQVVIADDSRG